MGDAIGTVLQQNHVSPSQVPTAAPHSLLDESPVSLPTIPVTETNMDHLLSSGPFMFDIGNQGEFLLDTLGDDLSAFLQAGVPNSQVDMGSSWFWEA